MNADDQHEPESRKQVVEATAWQSPLSKAYSPAEALLQARVYACAYCGHLLAHVSEREWKDWRQEPSGGTWACPNCRRATCDSCEREATRHFWGNVSSYFNEASATFTCREDALLCPPHAGGMRRRLWRHLHNDEPLDAWLARGVWTTPLYLHKHVEILREECHA